MSHPMIDYQLGLTFDVINAKFFTEVGVVDRF
jgi:hypothetical protein